MAEEIDLTPEQDAALEIAWAEVAGKVRSVPPSRFDDRDEPEGDAEPPEGS